MQWQKVMLRMKDINDFFVIPRKVNHRYVR